MPGIFATGREATTSNPYIFDLLCPKRQYVYHIKRSEALILTNISLIIKYQTKTPTSQDCHNYLFNQYVCLI